MRLRSFVPLRGTQDARYGAAVRVAVRVLAREIRASKVGRASVEIRRRRMR